MAPFLLAFLAGLALVAAFPPYGLGWMSFVGAALFFLAIRRVGSGWQAVGVGFLTGVVFYGLLMWWISNLGFVAWVPLIFGLAAYLALLAVAVFLLRSRSDFEWVFWATAIWAVMELARARFPLGGLPWGALGFTMGEFAWTRGAAQWIGASGWTLLIVATGAAAAVAFDRRDWRWLIPPGIAVGVLAFGGGLWPATADGNEIRVAIVQGENPCPGRRCPGERAFIYQSHLALTRQLQRGEVDLVVWAESSAGFSTDPVVNPDTAAEIGAETMRLGAYLLMGSDRPVGDENFENVTILFGPTGEILGEYKKVHPVPFGEYVPARPLFDWIPELQQVPRDMISGSGPVTFDMPQGTFGSVISFEAAFHRYIRGHVADGADLMVVATNQASYGISPASDQLIGITRMRAAELGIDLVHSAVSGRSTFINASGDTGYRTGLYTAEVIQDTVRFRTAGPTVYFLLRDWVAFTLVAAVVVLEIRRRRRLGAETALDRRA